MNKLTWWVLIVLLGAGCATPERRIRRDPAAFAALSPEQQEIVRAGNIALGLPESGVRLALGSPRRMYTRTGETGVSQVWSYVRTDQSSGSKWATVTSPDGRSHLVTVDEYTHTEIEILRVEFREGLVAAVEQLNR